MVTRIFEHSHHSTRYAINREAFFENYRNYKKIIKVAYVCHRFAFAAALFHVIAAEDMKLGMSIRSTYSLVKNISFIDILQSDNATITLSTLTKTVRMLHQVQCDHSFERDYRLMYRRPKDFTGDDDFLTREGSIYRIHYCTRCRKHFDCERTSFTNLQVLKLIMQRDGVLLMDMIGVLEQNQLLRVVRNESKRKMAATKYIAVNKLLDEFQKRDLIKIEGSRYKRVFLTDRSKSFI